MLELSEKERTNDAYIAVLSVLIVGLIDVRSVEGIRRVESL